jgi:hypothetical protein
MSHPEGVTRMATDESDTRREPARCPPRSRGRAAREARSRRPSGVGLFASVVVMALSATVLTIMAAPQEAQAACRPSP